jgi:CRISPR-associated protein Cmr4
LARLKRLALLAGVTAEWGVPSLADDEAQVASSAGLSNGKLILEAFEFKAVDAQKAKDIAQWLADNVLPSDDTHAFFRDKLKTDLVVLSDTDFAHFARHAMVVEPHVRIDDDSGTASDGGLFYTENLPPESILAGLAQASVERFKKDKKPEKPLDADAVLAAVFEGVKGENDYKPGIVGQLLQIGGDATTGRGLVLVHPVKTLKS